MIISAIVILAGLMIKAILALMSPFSNSHGFPPEIDTAILSIDGYIDKANTLIPLESIHTFITFVIAFELLVMYFYIMRWLVGYLPFIGGR